MSVTIKNNGKLISLQGAKQKVDSGEARVTSASPAEIEHVEGTKRARQGPDWPFPFGPWFHPTAPSGRDIELTDDTLRSIYRRSSAVGAAVDFIVRSLSTTPWRIVAQPGVRKRDFDHAVDILSRPGAPGSKAKTFSRLLSLILNDLMVLDKVVIEKVRSAGGGIVFLEPRDAATFKVETDDRGDIDGFKQKVKEKQGNGEDEIDFPLEDIVYFVFYPRTNSVHGTPRIEKIVNEVSALLLGIDSIASFFSEDEIPPGLLHLGEIGEEIAKRAQADFESNKGMKGKRKITVIGGKGEPRWVQFRRPFKEMEISAIMPKIERAVWRVFGISPLDQGAASDVNRSTAEAFERLRAFNLFKPILDIVAEEISFNILHEIDDRIFLEFIHEARVGSDTEGGDITIIDTDIPGEGEGSDVERATPIFGATNPKQVRAWCVSSPTRMPIYKPPKWSYLPRCTKEEALSYIDEDLKEDLGSYSRALKAAINTLVDEGLETVEDLSVGASSSEIRTLAESVKSEIIPQIEYALHSSETAVLDYLREVLEVKDLDYSSSVDFYKDELDKRLEAIFVDQLAVADSVEEEIAMIRGLDYDLIDVDRYVENVAAGPIMEAVNSGSKLDTS